MPSARSGPSGFSTTRSPPTGTSRRRSKRRDVPVGGDRVVENPDGPDRAEGIPRDDERGLGEEAKELEVHVTLALGRSASSTTSCASATMRSRWLCPPKLSA